MIEALTDPKTWLFALFSALDNVPNSLTNQRSIIINGFGFSVLQTTLLGCVDGVIEILTIFTGVKLAARYPNSIAWVSIIYFLPTILGCILINVLPWTDQIGLLFSIWLTGSVFLRLHAPSIIHVFLRQTSTPLALFYPFHGFHRRRLGIRNE